MRNKDKYIFFGAIPPLNNQDLTALVILFIKNTNTNKIIKYKLSENQKLTLPPLTQNPSSYYITNDINDTTHPLKYLDQIYNITENTPWDLTIIEFDNKRTKYTGKVTVTTTILDTIHPNKRKPRSILQNNIQGNRSTQV